MLKYFEASEFASSYSLSIFLASLDVISATVSSIVMTGLMVCATHQLAPPPYSQGISVLSIHPTRSFIAPASFLPALPDAAILTLYSFQALRTPSIALTVRRASSLPTYTGGARLGDAK
jgi:hypothetical protein